MNVYSGTVAAAMKALFGIPAIAFLLLDRALNTRMWRQMCAETRSSAIQLSDSEAISFERQRAEPAARADQGIVGTAWVSVTIRAMVKMMNPRGDRSIGSVQRSCSRGRAGDGLSCDGVGLRVGHAPACRLSDAHDASSVRLAHQLTGSDDAFSLHGGGRLAAEWSRICASQDRMSACSRLVFVILEYWTHFAGCRGIVRRRSACQRA